MKDDYGEWNKIKFKVFKEVDIYRIVSVDFGAIPIAIISPVELGIKEAKMKALKALNKYNSKIRWRPSNVGDSSVLLKVIKKTKKGRKLTMYRFYKNNFTDLKFIEHETASIKQETKKTKTSNRELQNMQWEPHKEAI